MPGAADRIFTMAEKEQEHRQKIENNIFDIVYIPRDWDDDDLGFSISEELLKKMERLRILWKKKKLQMKKN